MLRDSAGLLARALWDRLCFPDFRAFTVGFDHWES